MNAARFVLATSLALALSPAAAAAQEMDHAMDAPAEEQVPAGDAEPQAEAIDPHAGHHMPPVSTDPPPEVDHAAMGHTVPAEAEPPVDHAAMGHAVPAEAEPPVDHAAMGHAVPAEAEPPVDHAAMGHTVPAEADPPVDHAAMGHAMPADTDLPAGAAPLDPIPQVTAADRAAAFPDVAGHTVHDDSVHSYWLVDHLEAWDADDDGTGVGWEALAWIGTDLDRVWLRSEGERVDGTLESADIEVLYGRAIAPWWDLLAGVRHDFGEGPSQTFAAIGVMGLTPYKFELAATGYVGQSGQTAARLEAEYDTLLTNRLILQWLAEAEFHGQDDPARGIGSGLGTVEAGLRLRYELRREFAPYIGVAWERAHGGTADLRRAGSEAVEDTRVVAGVRVWF